jgi:hypothetical protein
MHGLIKIREINELAAKKSTKAATDKTVIELDDGKYRFYIKDNVLVCERYGGEWRNFIGDKAVMSLFDRCLELLNK